MRLRVVVDGVGHCVSFFVVCIGCFAWFGLDCWSLLGCWDLMFDVDWFIVILL